MLDLDELAARRAKTLNQSVESWREIVWSAGFQQISASMSDGEVEELIALCPSIHHLKSVVDCLVRNMEEVQVTATSSPFNWLVEEAAKAGLKPGDWIKQRMGSM